MSETPGETEKRQFHICITCLSLAAFNGHVLCHTITRHTYIRESYIHTGCGLNAVCVKNWRCENVSEHTYIVCGTSIISI